MGEKSVGGTCCLYFQNIKFCEDGGSSFPRNVGNFLPNMSEVVNLHSVNSWPPNKGRESSYRNMGCTNVDRRVMLGVGGDIC